jgi:hypothetical protein
LHYLFEQYQLNFGMEAPNRKLLGAIAKTVFPERFKVDPQGTLVLAFKWWREYMQGVPSDQRLDGEMPHKVTCTPQQSSS